MKNKQRRTLLVHHWICSWQTREAWIRYSSWIPKNTVFFIIFSFNINHEYVILGTPAFTEFYVMQQYLNHY